MYPYQSNQGPNPASLAVGDLLVVVSLITVGAAGAHGRTDPLHILAAAVPFVVGWFLIAPLAGAYGGYRSKRSELFALLGTWQAAALVGLGIRSTPLFAGDSPPSFGFVIIVLGGFTVTVWRLGVLRLLVAVVRWTR